MNIQLREYEAGDLKAMTQIWNEVVAQGKAFPQRELLTEETAAVFFASQTYTGVAVYEGEVAGLYILHPNNVGRCGHIGNASYAVTSELRGKHIGRALVTDCLVQAEKNGFRILQFNAVVKTNETAIRLYEKLGFQKAGMIPGGFCMDDETYEDIYIFFKELKNNII